MAKKKKTVEDELEDRVQEDAYLKMMVKRGKEEEDEDLEESESEFERHERERREFFTIDTTNSEDFKEEMDRRLLTNLWRIVRIAELPQVGGYYKIAGIARDLIRLIKEN